MKIRYRQKLFISFVIIFSLFAIGIILFEQSREREHKTSALEEKLDAYAAMIDAAQTRQSPLDSVISLFPHNIRLSIINRNGFVIYDNIIEDISDMENHTERPEILSARESKKGRSIRTSSSNEQKYLYYAKRFNSYYIRVALPYDIQVQNFLESDNLFLYYIIVLFAVMLFIIHYASNRFGKSIQKLRDFTLQIDNKSNDIQLPVNAQFPNDELGEIGAKIAQNYRRLQENEKEITLEREKLLQHVLSSEEGLCFFSADKSVEFYNGLFIQYLNTIADEANSNPVALFSDFSFEKITDFLTSRTKQDAYFETKITKQGKTFALRVNVFDNDGFEIIINNITKQEKTRLLKQEMTGNITHELRTPVTGIRGCLETVLEQKLYIEKERYFIQRAYNQILVLSELIQDMSLITKIEDAPNSFRMESVNIRNLLEELKKDMEIQLKEKDIQMNINVTINVVINGNKNLLYSIFRNLTDNVIRYAGKGVSIIINQYIDDKDFYYFSYADTGVGIANEQHLNRLFERFYRIDEGRTRDTGGSGLGLSIVKNAVLFHRGNIVAKNRTNGGLEFLFHLPKSR
jgi:signal transduction histidine kinase